MRSLRRSELLFLTRLPATHERGLSSWRTMTRGLENGLLGSWMGAVLMCVTGCASPTTARKGEKDQACENGRPKKFV